MTQVGNAATLNEKEVKTRYPVDKGLTAGTNTQIGRITNLVVQDRSLVSKRVHKGLNGR